MGHNRNLADYAHHFDGTNIDLGSGNIETEGVVTYEDVTNVDAIGIVTARTGVKVPDNQKVFLGTGDDLQVYHNGSDSIIIDNSRHLLVRADGTGNMYLQSDNQIILSDINANETFIECNDNGNVKLYYDNSKKLETTSSGVTVTGTLVSDGVTSELDLSAISASISSTAVDVFVYDTRKDSDGGAWRKRTQHTSWYNETLNTSTRGSRKEFPAVAVIVTETRKVTIYDGDDPDLPMWMIFNAGSGNALYYPNSSNGTSTVMLNGKLANAAAGGSPRFRTIDFLSDSHLEYAHTDGRTTFNINISQRNAGLATFNYGNVPGAGLIHRDCNDVAITVLPNAPIDDATGLPVPTIAVGTHDGVSVIKDDGTVMSTGSSSGGYHIKKVDFTDDHGLNAHIDSNSGGNKGLVYVDNIDKLNGLSYGTYANWDGVLYASRYATNVLTYKTLGNGSAYPVSDFISMSGTDAAVGSNFTHGGLTLLAKNNESTGQGMVAFVTSDFNTGYQHGDIKGAFLSDTDDTDAVVAYSDGFSNNDKGWGFVNCSISGGNLVITQQSQARATDPDALSHVSTGVRLVFTGTVSGSGTGNFIFDDDGAGAGQGTTTTYGTVSSTGSFTFTYTKTGSPRIRIMRTTGSNDYNINFLNITTEYDRSVNDKGLSVYGTVPKSAVATGADLVAYGAFGTTNYLKQPYNSDLAPGTGAYSVTCWFKTGTSNSDQYIFDRASGSGSRNLLLIMHSGASGSSANKLQWWHRDGSGNYTDIQITDKTVTDNIWHQVVALYDGSTYRVYVDGSVSSVTSSVGRNVGNDGSPPLYIGVRYSETAPMTGKLALFRYSKSAPSPEQIKKMYEDEKMLFQENAKVTFYGSSDAVTALGYDEDTELLHVGTSAGRSDFQGLRRINNTTTAVTTAISASDELIAEQ